MSPTPSRQPRPGGSTRLLLSIGVVAIAFAAAGAMAGAWLAGTPGARWLNAAWPVLLFVGALLLVLSWALRAKPGAEPVPLAGLSHFGRESTDFVSRMDAPATRPQAGPVHRGQRPPATHWSEQVFRDVEWRRIEAVRALLFARTGRESSLEPSGAVDEGALLALILQQPPDAQQALLEVAYEGEYWRPSCARCGLKMVEHSGPHGVPFWACADHPRCSFTLPARSAD